MPSPARLALCEPGWHFWHDCTPISRHPPLLACGCDILVPSLPAHLQVVNQDLQDVKAQLEAKEKELTSSREALERSGVNASRVAVGLATDCINRTDPMSAEKPSWVVRRSRALPMRPLLQACTTAPLHCTVQDTTASYPSEHHRIALFRTPLHCTVQCATAQHSTAQIMEILSSQCSPVPSVYAEDSGYEATQERWPLVHCIVRHCRVWVLSSTYSADQCWEKVQHW